MFTIKAYSCWCHVCGSKYIHQSEFLSGPSHVDGNTGINYQVRQCGKHSGSEIREAYEYYKKTGNSLNKKGN